MLVTRFAYIKMADHRNENNNDQSVNIDGELSESAQNILQNRSQVEPNKRQTAYKTSKAYTPPPQKSNQIKQSERQPRRRLSHSVGSNTRQTIETVWC